MGGFATDFNRKALTFQPSAYRVLKCFQVSIIVCGSPLKVNWTLTDCLGPHLWIEKSSRSDSALTHTPALYPSGVPPDLYWQESEVQCYLCLGHCQQNTERIQVTCYPLPHTSQSQHKCMYMYVDILESSGLF